MTFDEQRSNKRTPKEFARRGQFFKAVLGKILPDCTFEEERMTSVYLFEYADADEHDHLSRRLTKAQEKQAIDEACKRNGGNSFRTSQLRTDLYDNPISLCGVDIYHIMYKGCYWGSYACVRNGFVAFKDLNYSYTN